MGMALKDGYRQKAFLMTKFDGRTRQSAAAQIDESLRRLQTDHVDLMQFHENIRMDDPDRFFAKDGAVEAVVAAKKAGKIRYVGFTGHKDPSIHLRMLEVAAAHDFHFDACQMPLNVMSRLSSSDCSRSTRSTSVRPLAPRGRAGADRRTRRRAA